MTKSKFGITRHLWIPLLVGIISIGLGIWCLCSPVSSIPVMAYIFAGILCVAGVFNVTFAFINRRIFSQWGWSLAMGILDIVAGIWMFCLPQAELSLMFIIVLGIWLVCVAINAICETMTLSSDSVGWTIVAVLLLILTIYCAVVVLSSPAAMAVMGWMYLGISLIAFGVVRIALYGRLRKIIRKSEASEISEI